MDGIKKSRRAILINNITYHNCNQTVHASTCYDRTAEFPFTILQFNK